MMRLLLRLFLTLHHFFTLLTLSCHWLWPRWSRSRSLTSLQDFPADRFLYLPLTGFIIIRSVFIAILPWQGCRTLFIVFAFKDLSPKEVDRRKNDAADNFYNLF